MTTDQFLTAAADLAMAFAIGSAEVRESLAGTMLLIFEIIAALKSEAIDSAVQIPRVEQLARRIIAVESTLADIEPRRRAKIGMQRLGVGRTQYYEARQVGAGSIGRPPKSSKSREK